ncbi:MAG TPA: hypothetical protein VMF06_04170 [Candidatus Limnocylindria bacterium]|nr:hypothetical protein [Candidatus Limnocylindria bacterium]
MAADAVPKDDVLTAARKLADRTNYSWKTVVVVPESAQFKPGPTDGKTEKGGFTLVSMSFGDRMTEMAIKGDKTCITDPDGEWQSSADLEKAEGPARFMAWIAKNFKNPVDEASELAKSAKELKKDGEVYSADLTDEGAKGQFRFGSAKDAKGSVKFWVKEGQLAKYEFKVQGKVEFGGNEMDVDRTTTVEIKAVDATTIKVPEAAKKKLT